MKKGSPRAASPSRVSGLAGLAELAAFAALALGFIAWLADPAHAPGRVEGNDFRVFYDGAVLFRQTGNPYGQGFVSPPWFALFLLPFTLFPYELAAWLWLGLSMVATAAAAWLALGLVGMRPTLPRALALSFALALWPAGEAVLVLGQNSAFVLAFAVGAVAAMYRGLPSLSGGLLGLALVKPHLVGLLGLALFIHASRSGRGKAFALGAVGVAGALLALTLAVRRAWVPVLAAGLPETWNFWGSTVSTTTLLATLLGAQEALRPLLVAIPLLLGVALTAGLLWRERGSFVWQAAVILALTLLSTPYAYPHDYVLLLLPFLLAVRLFWRALGVLSLPGVVLLAWLLWVLPRPWVYDDLSRFTTLGAPAALLGILLAFRGSR